MIATIPCMTKNGHRAFVDTFTRLWDRAKAEGKSQEKFSKDIGVSQKTVSNILHAIENKRNIRLDTIESVAKGLGIETWQLLVPEMPIDLILNHRLTKLITSFKNADEARVSPCSVNQTGHPSLRLPCAGDSRWASARPASVGSAMGGATTTTMTQRR